jgi:hypothetical protein
VIPPSAAASSLADSPSTMKLFERLRWLLTERLAPITAEVSGNNWELFRFVGEIPGTTSASSWKLRPLSGRFRTSISDTVAAI